MTRAIRRFVLAATIVCVTAGVSRAQQTTTTRETKGFEVLAVDGKHAGRQAPGRHEGADRRR